MGGINSTAKPKKQSQSLPRPAHCKIQSKVVQEKVQPTAILPSPQSQSISIQTQSLISSQIHSGASSSAIPMSSPNSDSYSGSLQSLNSSANVSNKNVMGNNVNKQQINQSQHINSENASNVFSSFAVPDHKEQKKTEYSEGRENEEGNGIYMTT